MSTKAADTAVQADGSRALPQSRSSSSQPATAVHSTIESFEREQSLRKTKQRREVAVAHSDEWYERAIKGIVFEEPHGVTCEFVAEGVEYYVKTGFRGGLYTGHFDREFRRVDRKAVDAVLIGKWWVDDGMIRIRINEVHIIDKDTPAAEKLVGTTGKLLQGMQILAVDKNSLTVKFEISGETIRFGRIVMTVDHWIQADPYLKEMANEKSPGTHQLVALLVDAARKSLLEGRYLRPD